ncbi:MAG: transcriptional regulator [Nitrospirae bacterium]|nr:transcriptional regulator [Nitrospirota bacterium]
MKNKPEPVPKDRKETIRRQIISALKGKDLTAQELSGEVRVSEKEVYGHLQHIQKSLGAVDYALTVTPAGCRKCGFVFRKREKLKKPGKCPVCRSESIEEPVFRIG